MLKGAKRNESIEDITLPIKGDLSIYCRNPPHPTEMFHFAVGGFEGGERA